MAGVLAEGIGWLGWLAQLMEGEERVILGRESRRISRGRQQTVR